jgi:hypothetical protein
MSNYALYEQLRAKIGEAETVAHLDHVEQRLELANQKVEETKQKAEMKRKLVTQEILRYKLIVALADQKWEFMKNHLVYVSHICKFYHWNHVWIV